MGHRKFVGPRHGSLSYRPRKRAQHHNGRMRWTYLKRWKDEDTSAKPRILGFAGYKAGMTHVIYVENNKNSPFLGLEVVKAVTIVDCPPMILCGIKGYKETTDGLQTVTEVWAGELNEDLKRLFPFPKDYDLDKKIKEFEEKSDECSQFRVLMHTQPRLAAPSKKKPELMEIPVWGGSKEEKIKFLKDQLGKEIRVGDIYQAGDHLDIASITKGKGFQGPVKRFGIKILTRKTRGTKRGVGSIGPWKPARVMYTVPRAGQMGYHHRIEYNKRILKIGNDPKEVIPAGGFLKYGVIRGDYLIMEGTIPGPRKRLIKMRHGIRTKKLGERELPDIQFISLQSKQGK
ncbi:MAG: 50S ribosomal protein L3 [Candidatus Helarchaeota archaeon]